MDSILDKTQNFYRLYQYICGESDIPEVYHFWCCVSLLAAVLEDRVWYEDIKDDPLKSNLFIFLVGPGSLGKGVAISQAVKLAEDAGFTQRYRGRITYAHLIDRLGTIQKDDMGNKFLPEPKLWLVMDELKNDLGSNRMMTDEFVAMMTEIYTATNYTLNTGTRTHGGVDLVKPCVNWLAGSTPLWLRQTLTKDVFESGFVARTNFIFADYDFDKRIRQVKYPHDRDVVYSYLVARLMAIPMRYRGRFIMTSEAEAEHDKWIATRPIPGNEQLYSIWFRHKTLLLKLSMVNCVADGESMVIQRKHLLKAIQMLTVVGQNAAGLISSANETLDSKPVNIIERYIEKKEEVDHTTLLRYARAVAGMDARKVQNAVASLVQERKVVIDDRGSGKNYKWKG